MIARLLLSILAFTSLSVAHAACVDALLEGPTAMYMRLTHLALASGEIERADLERLLLSKNPISPLNGKAKLSKRLALAAGFDKLVPRLDKSAWTRVQSELRGILGQAERAEQVHEKSVKKTDNLLAVRSWELQLPSDLDQDLQWFVTPQGRVFLVAQPQNTNKYFIFAPLESNAPIIKVEEGFGKEAAWHMTRDGDLIVATHEQGQKISVYKPLESADPIYSLKATDNTDRTGIFWNGKPAWHTDAQGRLHLFAEHTSGINVYSNPKARARPWHMPLHSHYRFKQWLETADGQLSIELVRDTGISIIIARVGDSEPLLTKSLYSQNMNDVDVANDAGGRPLMVVAHADRLEVFHLGETLDLLWEAKLPSWVSEKSEVHWVESGNDLLLAYRDSGRGVYLFDPLKSPSDKPFWKFEFPRKGYSQDGVSPLTWRKNKDGELELTFRMRAKPKMMIPFETLMFRPLVSPDPIMRWKDTQNFGENGGVLLLSNQDESNTALVTNAAMKDGGANLMFQQLENDIKPRLSKQSTRAARGRLQHIKIAPNRFLVVNFTISDQPLVTEFVFGRGGDAE